MTIAVASGKGGTGKTTLSVNMAYALAETGANVRLLDCDVEEPNDHLFVRPTFAGTSSVSILKPVFDDECVKCGRCADSCRYNAIAVINDTLLFFPELCHACGVCSCVCPTGAVHEEPVEIGIVRWSDQGSPFFSATGELRVGEALSPNVVREVKSHIAQDCINILDAPPGTGCPVVATVEGADAVLLVTEPTPFGLHDLRLAAELTLTLCLPTAIVVNRSDGHDRLIEEFANEAEIPIVGRIPFRRHYAESCAKGDILVHTFPELAPTLTGIYGRVVGIALRAAPMPRATTLQEYGSVRRTTSRSAGQAGHRGFAAAKTHQVAVISGKGGTGKTTITAAFASLDGRKVFADTDVDAADLGLILKGTTVEQNPFTGGRKAYVIPGRCDGCGACAVACHFDALVPDGPPNGLGDPTWRVESYSCEGCGLCVEICRRDAIEMQDTVTGEWCVTETPRGPLVHATLGIAAENSGRLVTRVRQRAAQLAEDESAPLVLGDGPPGIACPVIASLSGIDMAVIVTEPTVSAVSDLQRTLDLAERLQVPARIIINKFDLNQENTRRIDRLAIERGVPVIGRVPFEAAVNDALMAATSVIEWGRSEAAQAIRAAWDRLTQELETQNTGGSDESRGDI
jgi:MinD superfamily P-loop ATPase